MMRSFADAVIASHGVTLRPLTEADVPWIAVACSDAQTQKWLPLPRPYTDDSARSFVCEMAPQALASGVGLERAIEVDGQFVGVIGLKSTDWVTGTTEAGYWLGPWARGRGITARALTTITDWALDTQGINRVEVHVATGNAASLATARKAMFIEEGTLRQAGHTHGGLVDLVMFSRLADDPRPQADGTVTTSISTSSVGTPAR